LDFQYYYWNINPASKHILIDHDGGGDVGYQISSHSTYRSMLGLSLLHIEIFLYYLFCSFVLLRN
jgi:hypothetical protein